MKIRILGLATLCFGLALTSVAQRGPRAGFEGQRGGGETRQGIAGENAERNPLGRLVTALDLNEAQIVAAEALLAVRVEATESIQALIQASRDTMPDLIAAAEPTAIGNAVLAQHALREQMRAIQEQFLFNFNNVLTSTQQAQFASIQEMGRGGFGRGSGDEGSDEFGAGGGGRRGGPRGGPGGRPAPPEGL
jgi:hypothetical protein